MWIARYFRFAVVVLLLAGFPQPHVQAQTTKSNTGAGKTASSSAGALALAQQGHCKEAIPGLKSMMVGSGTADTKKSAGVTGLRCALALDDRNSASDFIRQLNKQFPNDPDILFILVHAYSDLSTRTAQDLGRTAPQSVAAHKLNAEALEMQGKWDDAQRSTKQSWRRSRMR